MPAPTRPLRIVVADEPSACRAYQDLLPALGHQVVALAHTGRELVERCLALRPDLAVAEIDLPGLDGVLASVEANREGPTVPFVLVSAGPDAETLVRLGADHVMAALTKPVKREDLVVAVHLAVLRFGQYLEASLQAADYAQALADRKLIERAKGVVMRRLGLDEEEAFRRLQKRASDRNQRLVEVAREVLVAEEAFRDVERG